MNLFVDAIQRIVDTSSQTVVLDQRLYKYLGNSLEQDQVSGLDHWKFLKDAVHAGHLPGRLLLDIGCGTGSSKPRVEELRLVWKGLDIPDSQESLQRTFSHDVTLYDGTTIPFDDNSFDVLLAIQSLEHVQNCETTFSEIARILKPKGRLIGSTSHLEPYHSQSTFNYTPYGFKMMLQKNGLNLERIHPGIDAYALLIRKILMVLGHVQPAKEMNRLFNDHSWLNQMLTDLGKERGYSPAQINSWRLQFCGTFRFDVVKP